MERRLNYDRPIFMIEHCVDCDSHNWNNHHDEAKYKRYAAEIAAKITDLLPDARVLINSVPKQWFDIGIYGPLIANEDEDDDCYEMIPREGAMEISTVAEVGQNREFILLYSKLLANIWPNTTALA